MTTSPAPAGLPVDHAPVPPGPSIWVVMLALLGTHMAGMGAFLTVPVLAPAIAAETGLSANLAGVHTALCYFGALLSGPLSQGFLVRHGGVRVCQAALVGIAIGLALAVLGSPWALVLSAVVAGLAHGPITPAGSHLLAPRVPARRRSLIFGLKQCGVPAGAMLVAATAPLVGGIYGWRAGVLTMSGFALLLALALQPIRATLDADRAPEAAGRMRPWHDARQSLSLLRERGATRALTIASCGYGVAQFCFSSFFVVWQVETRGVALEAAGLQLALAQGGGVVGRVLWALIADRVGPMRVLAGLGFAIVATCLVFALAGPDWPGLLISVAAVAMGASAIGWNGVLLGEVARVAPPGRVGAATAALGFAFAATMIVMPVVFSLLVMATGGYAWAFGMCAMTAAAGTLALLRLRPAPAAPR
ncbi:MFS transporter [Roseococcus thiosulfatophilus]|uniref:MFS transporter n=1 Tax=Roseococcus thiosulfatophilus TaxID=35813 RepID=UPI001A8C295C|nr:MFS transporter [Roseococcus thiosulfatophilus]